MKQEESHLPALGAVLVSWLNLACRAGDGYCLSSVQVVSDRESLAATVL